MASSLCRSTLRLRPPLLPPTRVPRASSRFQTPLSRSNPLYAFRCQIQTDANPQSTIKLKDDDSSSKTWKIKMLYDGDCPLCMREVNMLKERNKSYGAIEFVDISSKDYSPEENEGLDYETVMGRIHAILSDGTVVRDVEVATIANAIYSIWAKYRLQITGRPPLEEILESRRKDGCNDDKVCKTQTTSR
ncbi:uncharacterized protein At5g50100, mitochondrial isoform X2 [Ananas comosus]|uniref:Uncharacterized protein At5g50100, mitochondrial isoform X2 n=1 Tax=Ananas comosus TaxID=4615 RepID=A0A6P5FWL0_ANACO|nr:uncharacterized protein At5g50100, mitochondrial isoform X2 [Ananas comosus]